MISPVVVLYLVNGMVVVWFSSFVDLEFYFPLLMLLGVPVSYWIFFNGNFEEKEDFLSRAMKRKEEQMRKEKEDFARMRFINPFLDETRILDFLDLDSSIKEEIMMKEMTSKLKNHDEESFSLLSGDMVDGMEELEDFIPINDEDNSILDPLEFPGGNKKDAKIATNGPKRAKNPLRKVLMFALVKPWKLIFDNLLPYKKYSMLSFALISSACFLISSIQVQQADIIITKLHLSHSFIALTFFSWFNCATDIMTVVIASKAKKFDLALSTLFYAQVINLQISLNLGWFLKSFIFGGFDLNSSRMTSTMVGALAVLVLVWLLLCVNRWRLNFLFGGQLFLMYLCYVYCEFVGWEAVYDSLVTLLHGDN